MRLRPVFLCFVTMACIAMVAPARGVDPDITYQKIMEAPDRVSYRAALTKQRFSADGDTTRYVQIITHQRPDRDRIDIPDADGRIREVIIRVDHDIYRRTASGDSLSYSHRRQSNSNVLDMNLEFSSLDLLQTNYDLEIAGADRLARPSGGRPGLQAPPSRQDDHDGLDRRGDGSGDAHGRTQRGGRAGRGSLPDGVRAGPADFTGPLRYGGMDRASPSKPTRSSPAVPSAKCRRRRISS